jgi:hypothetical protein
MRLADERLKLLDGDTDALLTKMRIDANRGITRALGRGLKSCPIRARTMPNY